MSLDTNENHDYKFYLSGRMDQRVPQRNTQLDNVIN